jgi:hypothetical protein
MLNELSDVIPHHARVILVGLEFFSGLRRIHLAVRTAVHPEAAGLE